MIQALSTRQASLKSLASHSRVAAAFMQVPAVLPRSAGPGFLGFSATHSVLRPAGDPGPPGTPLRERRLHTRQGLWLAAEHQPDGAQEQVDTGREARESLRRETPRQEGRHSARRAALAEQLQRAVSLQPHLQTALLASSMLAGLEHPLHEVTRCEAPGIAHGLRLLALGPGDTVAECDPGDLALPVGLALAGCRVTLLHGDILTGARLWDELEAWRRGAPRGQPRQRPDGEPWLSPQLYRERARELAGRLSVYPVRDWTQLPGTGQWRALLSRGRLGFHEGDEAEVEIRAAARLLSPGGGLLFRMAHGAGEGDPANAGWTLRQRQLGGLEDLARRHGLNLRCAHLTFDSPGVASGTLLPPREVAAECSGWVDFRNVDAAAWDGWNVLQRETWVKQHPMTVEVSGMLEREG